MRRKFFTFVFLTAAILIVQNGPTAAAPKITPQTDWTPCIVQDPTGTPLNVRAKPNGKVLTTVKNGTLVALDGSTTGGKWVRISVEKRKKEIIGWVVHEFLSCG
jgi:hypothetical protein